MIPDSRDGVKELPNCIVIASIAITKGFKKLKSKRHFGLIETAFVN